MAECRTLLDGLCLRTYITVIVSSAKFVLPDKQLKKNCTQNLMLGLLMYV